MNKTIYMTYYKNIPRSVFQNWERLNKNYTIDFSLDADCISFLQTHFNKYIADLFQTIPEGMYKADLWRLCKLYIYGGVYADVDLIPHIDIDTLDKDVTFYSCLSASKTQVFQAFMINFTKPKNPLLLNFIVSFLINKPYLNPDNGPCIDMLNCIRYNLHGIFPQTEKKYSMSEIKIPITIGASRTQDSVVELHYFPDDIHYTIRASSSLSERFTYTIKNNKLLVKRVDKNSGWVSNHRVDIILASNEKIMLFPEYCSGNHITSCHVKYKGQKILDSHNPSYVKSEHGTRATKNTRFKMSFK